MGNPVESYLKEFRQQPDSTEDPVGAYLKEFGEQKQSPVATAPPPQEDTSGGYVAGAIDAVKEAAKGTAQFAGQLTAPFFTPPVDSRLKPQKPPEGPSGTELLGGAVVAPFQMAAEGTKQVISGQTSREKGHGAAEAVLGGLGVLGLAHGVKGLRGKPTTAAPVAESVKGPIERIQQRQAKVDQQSPTATASAFANAHTPEERAAVVEQLKKQAEATEQKQGDAKMRLMKAVTTWNSLSGDQRSSIVKGLATADYTKSWKELSGEARTIVKKALNLHEPTSGTNLDTSPVAPEVETSTTVPSVPAAQGEVASGEVPSTPAGPPTATSPPESSAPVEPPLDATDVQYMDINALRDERARAETKIGEMQTAHDQRLVKAAPKSVEFQHWEKYLEDIKDELALRLKRDPTGGTPKNTYEALDAVPEEPEKIVASVFKGSDGKYYEGGSHYQALGEMEKTGAGVVGEALFKTNTGRYVGRTEAYEIAKKSDPKTAKFIEEVGDKELVSEHVESAHDLYGEGVNAASGKGKPLERPSSQNLVGKRYTNPDNPAMSALITKNTKAGGKPYRVTYFIKDPTTGETSYYIHNHFDTAQEAHDFLTAPPQHGEIMAFKGIKSSDKLQGYVEQTKPDGEAGTGQGAPKAPIVPEPSQPSSEAVGGDTPGRGEATLEKDQPTTSHTGGPEEIPGLQTPEQQAIDKLIDEKPVGGPLQDLTPEEIEWLNSKPELSPQDESTLMREGVEPLDVERMDKIEQSIKDQGDVNRLIEDKSEITPEMHDELKGATLDDLDDLIDDVDAALKDGSITPEMHAKALFEIADHKRALKARGSQQATPQTKSKFTMPDTVGKDLNKFSADQLKNTLKSIGALLQSPDVVKTPEAGILRQELDRILDYQAQIRKQSEGGAGPALRTKEIDVEGRPNYERYFSQKVPTGANFRAPINMIKWLRAVYQGIVRPNHALDVVDRLYEGATETKLNTHQSASKLMEMMDGSMTQAETFLRGDGPFVPDGQGGFVKTGAKSLADIVTNTAKGDVERFGWLWVSRRALELKALRNKLTGVDLGYAQEMAINSSRELHQAVDEVRDYHTSLSIFARLEGLISDESFNKFQEETSYGPWQRMYGPQQIVSKVAETINKTGRTADQIMASDEFKRFKGSDLLIRNPVESTIDATHRILRAAKINRIALELVQKAIDQPDLFKGMIDRFEHREHLQIMRDLTARSAAMKSIFKEAGIDLSNDHASLFANLLSDDALDMKGGKLLVWREGKIEAWKVDELIANSLKSLTPNELAPWVKLMGAPARLGRLGIVLDPAFMVGQLINDQFQGWFNTKYKFTPVLDSFKGWWNIVHNSEAFREALQAGGVEKSALRGKTTLADIVRGPALAPGELAFQQLRTMHPLQAYQTLITPIREATRMGEYLKARGHGATPIEAAFAARSLLGNYSLQGTWTTIRALNHMSLFLNPAIQVTDKTFRTIKERPAQWFTRASTLAAGAALLYVANKDDEEIQQLRQTPGGQRWFFIRTPGGIAKIRKPYLEGAIFASGMEAFMDQWSGQNPDAYKLWAQSVKQELSLNMLPVMGVVPYELWANKDIHSDSPIIPESQQGLDPQFQTGYYSGTADRIVGKATGIPPAILSYVTRSTTGYLGESVVKTVSAGIDWANTGELPPKEDWPLTQRVFAKYPSYSVKPIQDFYKYAEKVDRAANTINYAAQHSPDDLEAVLTAHEPEMPLIELFNDSRQQISDLRKAIQSVEDLKDLGPQSKKQYTDEFLKTIIELSNATVQTARAIEEDQGQ